MSTQTSTINPREIAAELMLDAAREVDALAISEHLGEEGIDDPGDGITEQIAELISTASITVDWPEAEASEPATELAEEQAEHQATLRNQSALSAEVQRLRAELEKARAELTLVTDQRDAARAMADELRDDLRAADDNNGFLQQHIADIRSGAF